MAQRFKRQYPYRGVKIQRLFRRGEVTTLIKRCNDFGVRGIQAKVGELTDGNNQSLFSS